MSRRPNDRAAQNQQTIKTLLKLEGNKHCADCKRNKHPRWASWNLGIFICIRCSGIHRGMGTHISRVKSVDLDAWTDEQLQSVLNWGNSRANRYWEAKLAPGHVPSEAKIENFIRTKYESKRWVMDGPMPDPSSLGGDGDDDVPLNVVQERATMDRSASQRISSAPAQPPQPQARRPQPAFDLIGDDIPTADPPARPSTTEPASSVVRAPAPKGVGAQQGSSQLLGGLSGDFFGGSQPERPSSANAKPAGMSRPDLKQSILSLYSTPQSTGTDSSAATAQHGRQASLGGLQGSEASSSSAFGDLNDAFGGLKFGSTSSAPPNASAQTSVTSAFPPPPSQAAPPPKANPAPPQMSPPMMGSPPLAGGGFFDTSAKPLPAPTASKTMASVPPPLRVRGPSNASDGFGDFNSALNPLSGSSNATSSNGLLDLSPQPSAGPAPNRSNPVAQNKSIFNLTSNKSKAPPNYDALLQNSAPPTKSAFGGSGLDAWGSNDWHSNEPAVATPASGLSAASPPMKSAAGGGIDFGWSTVSPAQPSAPSLHAPSASVTSAWTTPDTTASRPPPAATQDWGAPPSSNAAAPASFNQSLVGDDGGWGSVNPGGFGSTSTSSAAAPMPAAVPKVAAEEDFGDWGSAPPVPTPGPAPSQTSVGTGSNTMGAASSKPGPSEDLFSNVWE